MTAFQLWYTLTDLAPWAAPGWISFLAGRLWKLTRLPWNKKSFKFIFLYLVLNLNQIVMTTPADASILFQRFILNTMEWHLDPFYSPWVMLPKFKVYTDVGKFQRISAYSHHSTLRPKIPAMQGTFIIIHLLQPGRRPMVLVFKFSYLLLNTRPYVPQNGVFDPSGKLRRTERTSLISTRSVI